MSICQDKTCLKDAYIIYLNADESIDATRKGNLARFINHSCLCAIYLLLGRLTFCIIIWPFLYFLEATYLWEDDDDRFSVENIPLYDSADDEPTSINKDILLSSHGMVTEYSSISTVQSTENPGNAGTNEFAPIIVDELTASSNGLAPMNIEPLTASSNAFTPMTIEPLNAMPMVAHVVENGSTEYSVQGTNDHDVSQNSVPKAANHANQTGSQNNSNHSALVPVKSAPKRRGRKPKRVLHKQLDIPDICDRLTSSVACEEILSCEEVKNQAFSEIDALYDEIRPAVEEHERDKPRHTSLAEKWIEASCCKYKAEFDLYAAIIKNIASTPLRSKDDVAPREQNGLKYLENGS
ncbi:unnamed protein product [Miscanthus lutarioriparius]|uniref:SET domain-containing protein n=1 Tax=Miscanthus lutarioriparius TaxID=422564 RepID=A0A811R2A6_9POAL|nr:unnamed protein product [Miscanthus lutarioriparius]